MRKYLKSMKIVRIDQDFTVCKLSTPEGIDLTQPYCFVGKTQEELSLVCLTANVPDNPIAREDGWKAFRFEGTLDFSLVGILARIASVLAEGGISIFAVSTYDTDYILVRSKDYEKALTLISDAGYSVV